MTTEEKNKPCPFCGIHLDEFGGWIDRETGVVHQQLKHPISIIQGTDLRCPLNVLVFRKEAWNHRE